MDANPDTKDRKKKEKLIEYPLPEEYQKYDTRRRFYIAWLVLIIAALVTLYTLFIQSP